MYINGKYYNYKYFVYDGCHKIYLIHKKDVYENSCSLRFISRWDKLYEGDIVPQCSDNVSFEKPHRKML